MIMGNVIVHRIAIFICLTMEHVMRSVGLAKLKNKVIVKDGVILIAIQVYYQTENAIWIVIYQHAAMMILNVVHAHQFVIKICKAFVFQNAELEVVNGIGVVKI